MHHPFQFNIINSSKLSRARTGQIVTPHGTIDTPNFVAVGTNGTIKALDSLTVEQIGIQLMFCNTYHLMIQPGTDVVKQAGGLHSFIQRKSPIITDSGGFQVFSLAYGTVKDELKSRGQKKTNNCVLKINEEGVLFRSYKDGSKILLTPESSVLAQKDLGADIIIPFDELPPYHIDPTKLKRSLERTHRWQKRSLDTHLANRADQAMYAVVHGGIDQTLRAQSAHYLSSLPFDGFAIGGSLGKTRVELFNLLDFLMPHIPSNFPNHLLGIGDLESIDYAVRAGIDTFDSSHPTRCARHGLVFTSQGTKKITASSHRYQTEPIDPHCVCPVCTRYSAAYLTHLFKAHEMTGYTLATIHNLHFMVKLMEQYRAAINNGKI
jgi:queuine tRNA-ribosyltransferase